ncbi:MAG: hypothetical protein mread185_000373 [Mycoplasmataceae bacterium]|nr:MAG: hypothetical protein mread185_000373 [Mycoplasmataceae bacterium]
MQGKLNKWTFSQLVLGKRKLKEVLLSFLLAFFLFSLMLFFVWLVLGSEIILLVLKKSLMGRKNLTSVFLLLLSFSLCICSLMLFSYPARFKSKKFVNGFLVSVLCLFIVFLGFLLVFKVSYYFHTNSFHR